MKEVEYDRIFGNLGFFKRHALQTKKPEKLMKLARTHKSRSVRQLALYRLITEGLLKDEGLVRAAALNDEYYKIRKDAVEVLTDQMTLEKVALTDSFYSVRAAAVPKLNDPEILRRIVRDDESSSVCIAAAEKITDQDALSDIVKAGKNRDLCRVAARKLDFDHALQLLHSGYETFDFPSSFVPQCEQADLAVLARKHPDESARVEAIKRLDDQTFLKDVVQQRYNLGVHVWETAVERLNDEEVLKDIALNDTIDDRRRFAIRLLDEQNTLADIAILDRTSSIRDAAVKRLVTVIKDGACITDTLRKGRYFVRFPEELLPYCDGEALSLLALFDDSYSTRGFVETHLKEKLQDTEKAIPSIQEKLAAVVERELGEVDAAKEYSQASDHIAALSRLYRLFHPLYRIGWRIDRDINKHSDESVDEYENDDCYFFDNHTDEHSDVTEVVHIDSENPKDDQ